MIPVHLKTGKLKTLSCFLISLAILSVTGCTSNKIPQYKGAVTKRDGAPREKIDASKIPDAEPKVEARSKYGNPKSYVVKGRRYHVLKSAKGYNRVGHASWYGTKFHGKLTSSRERYNLYSMTGASPHLPIPTYLKVTNLENGKSVVIKIVDRGPFKRNRFLDLSYGAALKLGYAHKGTARVRAIAIDPVQWAKEKGRFRSKQIQFASYDMTQKPKHLKGRTFAKQGSIVHLQVGAFSNRTNAEQLKVRLARLTQHPIQVNRDMRSRSPIYRVQITSSHEESDRLQKLLQRHGLNPLMTVTG